MDPRRRLLLQPRDDKQPSLFSQVSERDPLGGLVRSDAESGNALSFRYAGDTDDWKFDSISLYQYDLFFGLEYYEWADTTEVNGMPTVGSLIITGQNYWTVYT